MGIYENEVVAKVKAIKRILTKDASPWLSLRRGSGQSISRKPPKRRITQRDKELGYLVAGDLLIGKKSWHIRSLWYVYG